MCSFYIHIYIFLYFLKKSFANIPIEFEQFANHSIWPKDGILIGTVILGLSELGSNCREEVLNELPVSRMGT